MTRRAILQIGTEKTGTTTLQKFLAQNREKLWERGYVYPRFCGDHNHTGLAAYALDDKKEDGIRAEFGGHAPDDLVAMRKRIRDAATLELKDGGDAIFCNEHCHSRLNSLGEVARLRDFLFEHFDEVRISAYLRRQDQVALSLYSTRLKSGGVEDTILPSTNFADPYFNYAVSLSLWEQCFGKNNMRVRLFDRKELVGGSVIDDFLHAWELGAPDAYKSVRNNNESILPVAQEFLRRLNGSLNPVPGQSADGLRGPLASALARFYPGAGARPARADARAFYDQFHASNEIVRQAYFPDRDQLFDLDFEGYPDTCDSRDFTLDEICGVAARIYTHSAQEIRRLEAEIAVRDARLHWAHDRSQEALTALQRAVSWQPKFGEAYRMLAEYMFRLDHVKDAREAAEMATRCKPACDEYWNFLGIVLRRAGDSAGAAEMQRRALELNPSNAGAKRELQLALANEPEPEDAKFGRSCGTDGPRLN